MFQNIVIGKPLVTVSTLLAFDEKDWEEHEKKVTLFTETRSLPHIMKEAGLVSSISEVKRNQPQLCINLNTPDCLWLKWGKKWIYIVIGE